LRNLYIDLHSGWTNCVWGFILANICGLLVFLLRALLAEWDEVDSHWSFDLHFL
jgi:hypothetical protein